MSSRNVAIIALLATVFIWGTTFVATKVALRDLPPFALALLRFVLASVVLVPLAWRRCSGQKRTLPWGTLALSGLVGVSLYYALQNYGLLYTTASNASLILASIPALTSVLSVIFLRERVGLWRGGGIAASVLGVVIIIVAGQGASPSGGGIVGDILMLGCAVAWAIYIIQVKALEGIASPTMLTAAGAAFGALFLVPLAGYEAITQPISMPTQTGWLAIVYLGLVASALPLLLWNYGVLYVSASEAAIYVNLLPAVTLLSSSLLLQETVAPAQLLGGVVVLFGVWLGSKQQSPRLIDSAASRDCHKVVPVVQSPAIE